MSNYINEDDENEKSPGSKLKHKKLCDINDKYFKITVLKTGTKMRENIISQFSALRRQINEQNEYFTPIRKNLCTPVFIAIYNI